MITAVDTSVLLDVFGADTRFGERSRRALRRSLAEGRIIACDVVWAELSGHFPSSSSFHDEAGRLGLEFSALDERAAEVAGEEWKRYRSRGGRRERMVADFLIGSHARLHAERLLTRDRGFYRTYFKNLRIFDPSMDPSRGEAA